MNIHICEEYPCPVRERELVEVFENGFSLSYVEVDKTKDLK